MSTKAEGECHLSFHRMDSRGHEDEIREVWQEIQSRVTCSFFLSWGWVSVWLDNIPESARVDFVVVRREGEPCCCFFLGVKRSLHHWLFYKTRAYFNETGDDEIDDLTIEYNRVLGEMGEEDWRELLSHPLFSDLEEIYFSNVTPEVYEQIDVGRRFRVKSMEQKPCYFVDLASLRVNGGSYLQSLSSNKRAQIRKSLSYYEEGGPLSVREASSADEALEFLDKLMELHQAQWEARGMPGAFVGGRFTRFHRQLIEERFDAGELQLLRIGSSKRSIGYLYNFVYRNRVYYYQSGFRYETANIARPGIVCHHVAIEYNLSRGKDVYNFLAGETQYKRSLSTHNDWLYNVITVRDNLQWKLERQLRRLKSQL